jgi:hypothetical protein
LAVIGRDDTRDVFKRPILKLGRLLHAGTYESVERGAERTAAGLGTDRIGGLDAAHAETSTRASVLILGSGVATVSGTGASAFSADAPAFGAGVRTAVVTE